MRTSSRSKLFAVATVLSSAGLLAGPARADAIDGDWCNGASHMVIEGSSIVTPGRNKTQGRYTRYSFAYVVPANEPGAGSELSMVMIRGQEIIHLTRPGQTGGPEVWRRCKPVS